MEEGLEKVLEKNGNSVSNWLGRKSKAYRSCAETADQNCDSQQHGLWALCIQSDPRQAN
jgi:hypothetical protein